MLSSAWKWVKENKWKTMAGVALVGGYVWYSRSQSTANQDKAQKQKMTAYWRESQLAADRTIHKFLPLLLAHTEQHTRLSEILTNLRNPENKPEDRARIFKELKIAVFASNLIYMYSVVFVATYMRISVNVVGRHLYASTLSTDGHTTIDIFRNMLPKSGLFGLLNGTDDIPQRPIDEPGVLDLSSHVRDQSLSSTEYFISTGLPILADIVSQACIGTLDNHPLEEKLTLDGIIDIFVHIRHVVEAQFLRPFEGRPGNLLESLLLPPEDTSSYPFSNPDDAIFSTGLSPEDMIRLLTNEKRNVIESMAFHGLFQHSVNLSFVALSEIIAKAIPSAPSAPKPTTSESSPASSPSNSQSSDTSSPEQQANVQQPHDDRTQPTGNHTTVESDTLSRPPQVGSPSPHPTGPTQFHLAKILPALSNYFKVVTDVNDNLLEERITGSNEINEFSYRVFHGPVKNQ